MQEAAQEKLGERYGIFSAGGLTAMPVFHYKQLLPEPSAEELMTKTATTLETPTEVAQEGFFDKLVGEVETPEFSENLPIEEHLQHIKEHIRNTEWKVGNYFFFKGGVDNDGQRFPHRVDKMLKAIAKFENGEVAAKTAYDEIVKFAQEAIDKPRNGQDPSSKAFYLDVVNHRVLGDDYEFATEPEKEDPERSLIS